VRSSSARDGQRVVVSDGLCQTLDNGLLRKRVKLLQPAQRVGKPLRPILDGQIRRAMHWQHCLHAGLIRHAGLARIRSTEAGERSEQHLDVGLAVFERPCAVWRTRFELVPKQRGQKMRQAELEHVDAGIRANEVIRQFGQRSPLADGQTAQGREYLQQRRQAKHWLQRLGGRQRVAHHAKLRRVCGLAEQRQLALAHGAVTTQQQRKHEGARAAGRLDELAQRLRQREPQRVRLLDLQYSNLPYLLGDRLGLNRHGRKRRPSRCDVCVDA
jgi:glutathione S-transferase